MLDKVIGMELEGKGLCSICVMGMEEPSPKVIMVEVVVR